MTPAGTHTGSHLGHAAPELRRSPAVPRPVAIAASALLAVNVGVPVGTKTYDTSEPREVSVTGPADLGWSSDGRFSVKVSVWSLFSPSSADGGDDMRTVGVFLRSVAVGGSKASS